LIHSKTYTSGSTNSSNNPQEQQEQEAIGIDQHHVKLLTLLPEP
jgi:hypothetical protein